MKKSKPEITYYGYPAHYCGAAKCRFWIVATVGKFCVSTIGDKRSDGERSQLGKNMEEIGSGRFFETFVFSCDGPAQCGCCPNLESYSEIETRGYNTAAAAMQGHAELLAKYARKAARA